MAQFTTPETPAGTRVRESLGRKREGTLTGETRLNTRTNYVQHLVDFDGAKAWATHLVIASNPMADLVAAMYPNGWTAEDAEDAARWAGR